MAEHRGPREQAIFVQLSHMPIGLPAYPRALCATVALGSEAIRGFNFFADIATGPISRGLILGGCAGLAVFGGVAAAEAPESSSHEPIQFDIPAEALPDALFAYTGTTGLGVLVEDGVADGRRSNPVRGRMSSVEALRILLDGTGLAFQYTSSNAFTLVPAAGMQATLAKVPADPSRNEGPDRAYFRSVQTAVKHALCSRAGTMPGDYRVAVQLWIDGAGDIRRAAFLGSTGERARDVAILETLAGLSVGEMPPAGLPQPVTLVILPRAPSTTGDCDVPLGSDPVSDR